MTPKDMDEVRRIKREVAPEYLAMPGVTGIATGYRTVEGEDTDEPCIRIYVSADPDAEGTPEIPSRIQGVAVEVIVRDFLPHSEPKKAPDEP